MADIYEIVEQHQAGTFGPAGRPVQVIRVVFKTVPFGDTATVDIPRDEYGHDTLDAAIRPLAAEMLRARGL